MRMIILLAAFFLDGCASAAVGRVYSADEQRLASDSLVSCLEGAADRLDDGATPANSIAKAILPICSEEIDSVIEAKGPYRSERAKRMAFSYMREHSILDLATQVVLLHRKGK